MSEKLTKFRKFTRYLPENTRTLHDVCPKNIFPEIWGGGMCPLLPSPTPMLMRYIKHAIKLKTSPATLAQLLRPS